MRDQCRRGRCERRKRPHPPSTTIAHVITAQVNQQRCCVRPALGPHQKMPTLRVICGRPREAPGGAKAPRRLAPKNAHPRTPEIITARKTAVLCCKQNKRVWIGVEL